MKINRGWDENERKFIFLTEISFAEYTELAMWEQGYFRANRADRVLAGTPKASQFHAALSVICEAIENRQRQIAREMHRRSRQV